jgi:hypothetical protein
MLYGIEQSEIRRNILLNFVKQFALLRNSRMFTKQS